jgi:exonuclease VII small subunit
VLTLELERGTLDTGLEELERGTLDIDELDTGALELDTGAEELERGALELDTGAEELERGALDTGQLPPPTTPNGEGCEAQVELVIQLLLFS